MRLDGRVGMTPINDILDRKIVEDSFCKETRTRIGEGERRYVEEGDGHNKCG